jgi:hypothetical protein
LSIVLIVLIPSYERYRPAAEQLDLGAVHASAHNEAAKPQDNAVELVAGDARNMAVMSRTT